ncbi:MAG: hypothetical protein LBP34_07090 [Flavobacteriaceae bacterium]|jgi:uncharacterized protein (UPF0333 family)|nr:hypothetical protein [Flavobacteriaceae bacterium]
MEKIKYIGILFFIAGIQLPAKVNSLSYDSSEITPKKLPEKPSEIYTGKDFIYEDQIQHTGFLARLLHWIEVKFYELLNTLFGFDLQADTVSGRQALWYSLVFVLFVLIIIGAVFFYKRFNHSLGRNSKNDLSAEEAEKNINEADLDTLIHNANKEKNYRLAIRFYYLKLLKLMDNRQLIEYEYQKTNYEYFYEIKNPKLKYLFKEVSFVFDYCWYGDHNAGESDFNVAKNKFSEIQQLISET